MQHSLEILERTPHTIIYIISDIEIGKVHSNQYIWTDMQGNKVDFPFADRNTIDEQINAIQFANKINDLVVKFIRKDDLNGNEMLVMERLYPISVNSLTKLEREKFIEDFEMKIAELHKSGFVHGDIRRPRLPIPECFDNIVLTKEGFRLIDTDFSVTLNRENVKLFVYKQMDEEAEIKSFKVYCESVN
jgi:tRNA A-37 threonylcarbamoyl transferase component Bud32